MLPTLFSDLAEGDWRLAVSATLAALVCGFFWEIYLTCLELEESAPEALGRQVTELRGLCRDGDWITDDPLGIGGILCGSRRNIDWPSGSWGWPSACRQYLC